MHLHVLLDSIFKEDFLAKWRITDEIISRPELEIKLD